ncbi:uncharacterized protein LOC100384097 [Zea mays]|jgi:hypothetical protein|uniref:uncharacterized protein LOC100384097 n=1 Tax=Zea mays TaxID=4577 RepID=UPI0002217966|nr:uncharacterized protein LOC100384097 [Zea mays]
MARASSNTSACSVFIASIARASRTTAKSSAMGRERKEPSEQEACARVGAGGRWGELQPAAMRTASDRAEEGAKLEHHGLLCSHGDEGGSRRTRCRAPAWEQQPAKEEGAGGAVALGAGHTATIAGMRREQGGVEQAAAGISARRGHGGEREREKQGAPRAGKQGGSWGQGATQEGRARELQPGAAERNVEGEARRAREEDAREREESRARAHGAWLGAERRALEIRPLAVAR